MTEFEKEALRRNVKAALVFLGPREVLALTLTELVARRDNACNQDSKHRLRISAQKIEGALNWIDGRTKNELP